MRKLGSPGRDSNNVFLSDKPASGDSWAPDFPKAPKEDGDQIAIISTEKIGKLLNTYDNYSVFKILVISC